MLTLARTTCAIVVAVTCLLTVLTLAWEREAGAFVATLEPPPDAIDPSGIDFRVLTYNVHALPELLAGDKPKRRLPLIGGRISDEYDVALLQEHFEFAKRLETSLAPTPFSLFHGNGPVRQESLGARFIHFLASIPGRLFAGSSVPLNSGLTTVVMNREELRAHELVQRPFDTCDGYFFGKSDCMASKGILGVRLEGPGIVVDLYNTHLDARGGGKNYGVREAQLAQLAEEIRHHSAGQAVIVAGDFNSRLVNRRDRRLLDAFKTGLGLTDVGARRGEHWGRSGHDLDYILYRSGAATILETAEAGEDAEFIWRDGRKPLSDHPALFARFRAVPAMTAR